MSVSSSNSFTMTSSQIIARAYAVLGVASEGEALTARMYADGLENLNLLIKTLGLAPHLWIYTEIAVTLVAGQAAYLITPKPLRIRSVRRRVGNIDTPLNEMARETYFDQPNKTQSPSTPTQFYYDPQQASGTLYLWPAPSASFVDAQTMSATVQRRMADMLLTTDELDMPQEWLQPVIWSLASDLETQYPVNDPRLAQKIDGRARELIAAAKMWDNEPASIYLQPDYQGFIR